MQTEPINLVLLMLVLLVSGGCLCLYYSPEALERIGRRMRARSRGMIAAKAAFDSEYHRSLEEDTRAAEARWMLAQLALTATIESEE